MIDRKADQSGREEELNENVWTNGDQEKEGVRWPAHLAQRAV